MCEVFKCVVLESSGSKPVKHAKKLGKIQEGIVGFSRSTTLGEGQNNCLSLFSENSSSHAEARIKLYLPQQKLDKNPSLRRGGDSARWVRAPPF